jgi:DNA-binding NarL/FixJ family response regulator
VSGPARPHDNLRVVLVEDEALFRDLLRVSLIQSMQLEVVGDFADGETALARAPSLSPDVAIVDIELGRGMNGIQAGRLLRRRMPNLGIVLLSNHHDPAFLYSVPAEEVAGWSYLLKKSIGSVASLMRAVQGAAAGYVVLDPQLIQRARPKREGILAPLSPRLREILDLIAQGFSNGGIAERLAVTRKTVENQINTLYDALQIDRSDLSVNPRVRAVLIYLQEIRIGP